MIYDPVKNVYVFDRTGNNAAVIGDEKKASFYPSLTLKQWDGKTDCSITYSEDIADSSFAEDNGIITWTAKDGTKTRYYEVEKLPIAGERGMEFEVIFDKPPAKNVLTMKIATKGLQFHLQTALTQAEIDAGHVRPDIIVGSYAVFKTDGKTVSEKAFHLYRPKAVDKDGNETWCEMKIDTSAGVLDIIIPQKFLDTAVYPVVVDPTFGYTSIGASRFYLAANQALCTQFTATWTGPVDKLVVYCEAAFGLGDNVKGVIWEGGNVPPDRPAITNGITPAVAVHTGPGWLDLPYSTKPNVVSGTVYRLGVVNELDFPAVWIYFDQGPTGNNPELDITMPYGSPSPWDQGYPASPDPMGIVSIYAVGGPSRKGFINFFVSPMILSEGA